MKLYKDSVLFKQKFLFLFLQKSVSYRQTYLLTNKVIHKGAPLQKTKTISHFRVYKDKNIYFLFYRKNKKFMKKPR